MKETTDHLGRKIVYRFPPKRIICLCPCITETLYELNLEEEIVGRTRYCIYPAEKVEKAAVVGGTKEIDEEVVARLHPDLIIAEKEENTKEIVETLEKRYPVFCAEVQSIADAYRMIEDMASLTDKEQEGKQLIAEIKKEFSSLPTARGKRAAYVIWRNPYMAVGRNTYIHSLLEEMGFANPFASLERRYPVVTEENFRDARLDYIFLASEPYSFKEKHKREFSEMAPGAKVEIIDGEMFWYGARMRETARYLREYMRRMEQMKTV